MTGSVDSPWAGYPDRHDRDGVHELRRYMNDERVLLRWDAATQTWEGGIAPERAADWFEYLWPVRPSLWARLWALWKGART